MTHQELEVWAREIVEAVLANQQTEDSRVELKSSWPDPRKAADRLAAHANAARGTSILWLIGVDEKNRRLVNIDPVELANWLKSVESFFDGLAPRLIDLNFRINGNTVVALNYQTHQGAEMRKLIADAYISMNRANRLVMAVLSVPSQHQQPLQCRQAHGAVTGCLPLIEHAQAKLSRS